MSSADDNLFPEVDKIISLLSAEAQQEIVVLAIPSHDKSNKPLKDQSEWASAALKVFADLYRGATAFGFKTEGEETGPIKGIFKTDDGPLLSG